MLVQSLSLKKKTLNYFFKETFCVGFSVVILSCVLHVLRAYESIITTVIFYIWLVSTMWFLPSTYRIVSILMAVFLNSNSSNKDKRPESNKVAGTEKRQSIKDELKKPQ